MDKQQIRDNHRHNTLVSSSAESRDDAGGDEALVARDEALPDIGEDADEAADEDDGTAAPQVRGRDDEEVGVAQGDGRGAEQHVDLGQGLAELLLEDQRHGRDRQRRHDADEDEDELVEDDDALPRRAPVQRVVRVLRRVRDQHQLAGAGAAAAAAAYVLAFDVGASGVEDALCPRYHLYLVYCWSHGW